MQIKLVNCNAKLLELGIDMQAIGSGNELDARIVEKIPTYKVWEYNYTTNTLILTVADETLVPDLSELGVVADDSIIG